MREWLIALGILVVGAILLDGVRRMRAARRDSLLMAQRMNSHIDRDSVADEYGNEFPSGPARVKVKSEQDELTVVERIEPSFSAEDTDRIDVSPAPAVQVELDLHNAESEPALSGQAATPVFDSALTPLGRNESDVLGDPRVIVRDDFVPPKKEPVKYKESKPVIVAERERREREMREREERERFETVQASLSDTMKISGSPVVEKKPLQDPELVIVVRVMARSTEGFKGAELLDVLLEQGLRYGHHNIFHYYTEAGQESAEETVFSLANVVNPGTFDLHAMDEFVTPGVSLFLPLPAPMASLAAFDAMLAVANSLARCLNGELRDEQRCAMTAQTIAHSRQRILEFEMKKRLSLR